LIFAIVGGINTGVDFSIFTLLYFFTALPMLLINVISYTVGVTSSFILNRNITFRDGLHPGLSREAVRFIGVNLVSLSTSTVTLYFLTLAGVHTLIAKVLVTALAGLINYFGFKVFVFRVKGH